MLLRTVIFLVLLALVGLLGHFGASNPGDATVRWLGYEVRTSAFFLASVLVVILVLGFYGGQLWVFLRDLPLRLAGWRTRKHRNEGIAALLSGLEAIAAGEPAAARRLADRAEKLLPGMESSQRIGSLLKAEAARIEGDEEALAEQFHQLEGPGKGSFLGVRGLLAQAVRQNQWELALDLAERAHALRPKSGWATRMLFEAHLRNYQHEQALALLPALHRYPDQDPHQLAMTEACLHMAYAYKRRDTDLSAALKTTARGLKACPDFVPLMEMEADLLIRKGRFKQAEKQLADNWKATPRLGLFREWLDLVERHAAEKIVKKATALTESCGREPYASLALGMACLRAPDFRLAREALLAALRAGESRTVYRLLAELEEAVSPTSRAGYEWLRKAVDAPTLIEPGDDTVAAWQAWQQTYRLHPPPLARRATDGLTLAAPQSKTPHDDEDEGR